MHLTDNRQIVLLGLLPFTTAQTSGYSSFNTTFDAQPVYGPGSPPYYPTPYGTGYSPLGDWEGAYASATAFVRKLSLVEKVNITTGTGWTRGPCVGQTGSVPSQGFNGLCLQDSPLGVRDTDYNTVFPPLSQAAKTWDRDLIRRHGVAMGEEFRGKGANVQLGPVCGPLGTFAEGGRNWEGFSPDPYLCGQAMFESIIGIQSTGAMACAKHVRPPILRLAIACDGTTTHRTLVYRKRTGTLQTGTGEQWVRDTSRGRGLNLQQYRRSDHARAVPLAV